MPFIDRSPLEYQVNSAPSIRRWEDDRAPTNADYKQFKVGDEWRDKPSNDWWKLCYRDQTQGIWKKMCGVTALLEEFLPDAGVSPVVPNAFQQITVAGGTGITTVGGLNTVTWNIDGDIAQVYTTDAGAAAPAANNINILGGTNINTAGAGANVTINLAATIPVTLGGTGVITITDHALVVGSGAAAITEIGPLTNGQLCIGSTGADPVAAALTAPAAGFTITGGAGTVTFALADDLAAVEGLATTGIVSRTAADTWAATTVTQHAVLIGNAGEVPAMLGPLTNGQLVIGSTGLAPAAATLTAGAGIAITNGAGSITITNTGSGAYWQTTSASGGLAVDNGYFCIAPGGALSLSLPATSAVGDEIEVVLAGATSWTITQGAGQQIRYGVLTTTAGAGGSLASRAQGDAVRLACYVANTTWVVVSTMGNFTVT